MKKKKLNLERLKVKSFVTDLEMGKNKTRYKMSKKMRNRTTAQTPKLEGRRKRMRERELKARGDIQFKMPWIAGLSISEGNGNLEFLLPYLLSSTYTTRN